jgi:hypothetical protein
MASDLQRDRASQQLTQTATAACPQHDEPSVGRPLDERRGRAAGDDLAAYAQADSGLLGLTVGVGDYPMSVLPAIGAVGIKWTAEQRPRKRADQEEADASQGLCVPKTSSTSCDLH